MRINPVRAWIHGARPTTLVLSISSVLIGVAVSLSPFRFSDGLHCGWKFWTVATLCLFVGIFFQIAVNYANDYSDGVRGTDQTRTNPASHSASHSQIIEKSAAPHSERASNYRLTSSGIFRPKTVLKAAAIAAATGCACGIAIIVLTGHYWIIFLGAVCLLGAWFYTGGKHPYGYAGFGELGVFVFFGLVAVLGTQYVVAGGIDRYGIVAAIVAGLLSVTTMMVNNIRDIDSDIRSGKKTLEVRLGRMWSRRTLVLVYVLSCIGIIALLAMFGYETNRDRAYAYIDFSDYFYLVGLVLFGVFLGAAWWVAWGVKKKRYASALGHSSLAAASASLLLLFVGVLVGF